MSKKLRGITCAIAVIVGVSTQMVVEPSVVRADQSEGRPGSVARELQKSFGAGNFHWCAIDTNGGVKCWGSNANGELGDGTLTDSATPVQVSGLTSGVTALAVGNQHSCAIASNSWLYCWGRNYAGATGNGSATDSKVTTPVRVGSLTNVVDVAAHHYFSCALTSAGAVWCWGQNFLGQLGTGTNTDTGTPVRTMASGAVDISVGADSACAITTSGGVKCWGAGGQGQIGNASATSYFNLPTDVTGLSSGVEMISVGQRFACALQAGSDDLKCWGSNLFGAIGDGSFGSANNRTTPVSAINMPSDIVAVSLGYDRGFLITSSGASYKWGGSSSGYIAPSTYVAGATVIALAASNTTMSKNCYLIQSLALSCNGSQVAGLTVQNPGPPSAPTISAVAGDGQVTVSVTAGSGQVPTSYDVTATPGNATCTVTAPATSCAVTGLTNGTQYSFTSTATGLYGTSAQSVAVSATPVALPAAPTLTVVQSGTTQMTVTVARGAGGGEPSSYTVTATPGGFSCTITPPASTCVLSGLTLDVQYSFAVIATNAAGSTSGSAVNATPTTTTTTPTTTTTTPATSAPPVTTTPGSAATSTTNPAGLNENTAQLSNDSASSENAAPSDRRRDESTASVTTTTLATDSEVTQTVPSLDNGSWFEDDVPIVDDGEVVVIVNGELRSVTVRRENGVIVIGSSDLDVELVGIGVDNAVLGLDSSGNLRVRPGDSLQVSVRGLEPGSTFQFGFSSLAEPIGRADVGTGGSVTVVGGVPADMRPGSNTLVLSGTERDGSNVAVSVGVAVGAESSGTSLAWFLIGVPLALAVAAGFFFPAVIRRRRDDESE